MIYLDWAATTPPLPEISDIMADTAGHYMGNPSSLHSEGRKSNSLLQEMRSRCAAVLSCFPEELVFTSGGTESNNMVVSSLYSRRDKGRIIVSGIEHPSVWEPVQALSKQGWEIKVIHPGKEGLISCGKLQKLITEETRMVLIMGVHNETGVIQPLKELAGTVRSIPTKKAVHIHCDLVQAAGKIPLRLNELEIDSASFSAHKIRGPRGAGLLYQRQPLPGLYTGGGQEGGVRPGTENLAAIAGMTAAFERLPDALAATEEGRERMSLLMKGVESLPGALLIPEKRQDNEEFFTPWILNCSFSPLPGEVLVRVLDEEGFAVSTGSACSSNKKSRTRALESMGVSHQTAFSSIRISQGPATTTLEIEAFIDALRRQIDRVGKAVR